MPENTATPMARRISAPAPCEVTSGTTPMMNAIEVIRIGRNRSRQASGTACQILSPCASRSRANSTMGMGFLYASPPPRFALARELEEDNGVPAREPHEHDEADLREDIVVAAGDLHAEDCTQQAHRHDQDHHQRQAHALVHGTA